MLLIGMQQFSHYTPLLIFALYTGYFCCLLAQTTSQEVCRGTQRCWTCDSIFQEGCITFFPNTTKLGRNVAKAPKDWMIKCEAGCCVKQVWYQPGAAYNITRIKRGCSSDTERYIVETHLQAHVCITEFTVGSAITALSPKTMHLQELTRNCIAHNRYKGTGQLCMCEGELCNEASSVRNSPLIVLFSLLLLLLANR